MTSSAAQRMQRAIYKDYPPAVEGEPKRRRFFPCLTCRTYATTGCVKRGHLVGEAEDVLPPLVLVPKT